ncbi:MAG TPA: NAD-binding protein, partial [Victivallales bacterium]|nr:NAD-binding protein [Victivallales bacterium]
GETVFAASDEVFIAGKSSDVMDFIEWATEEKVIKKGERIIIGGGANPLGKKLADELLKLNYDIRVIEENQEKAEILLDELGKGLMVINGDPTDGEILEEAGIRNAPCFISVMEDDEDNIMSCMLAKKKGAIKTISTVNKADYKILFSSLDMIDCFFSPSAVGVNSALKFLEEEKSRVIALVSRINKFVFEIKMEEGAELCETRIADITNFPEIVFAFLVRNNDMLPAIGTLTLKPGDKLILISDFDTIKKIEPYFYLAK